MIKTSQKVDRLTVVALFAVAALAVSVAVAKGIGREMFRGRPVSYPSRHYDAAPIQLDVFARAATPREIEARRDPRIMSPIRRLLAIDAAVPAEWVPGEVGDLRVPLENLGAGSRSIFVVRTTRRAVCAGLTGFSAGCLAGLPADLPLTVTSADPDPSGTGEPALAWGIVRNAVQRVDVIVKGTPHPALLAGNAYFFQLRDPAIDPEAIEAVVARLPGGKTVTVPALHGPPQTAPERTIRSEPSAP